MDIVAMADTLNKTERKKGSSKQEEVLSAMDRV